MPLSHLVLWVILVYWQKRHGFRALEYGLEFHGTMLEVRRTHRNIVVLMNGSQYYQLKSRH
jgi:hypothetical protein